MSVSDVGSVTPLSKGVSTQSVNGNNQVVSLDGGVSTMGSSGGITCYKAACSSGYYLDAPNSTYFTSTSKSGTLGLTCYKATGCKSGYYNGGSSYDYHGYKCSKCTYSCPSGYYEAGSTWTNYKLTSDSAYKVCNGDSSQKNSEKCYKRTYKTCTDYDSIYKSSIPSGQTCTPTYPRSGLTCYKDCRNSSYTLTHRMTLNKIKMSWRITDSDGNEIGSGSELASVKTISVNDTYTVSGGTYTVTYTVRGWVPCDKNGRPGYYCACQSSDLGTPGSVIKSRTFTVSGNTTVPVDLPSCGHYGCESYPCSGGSGGEGIKPVDPGGGDLIIPSLP